ncbi:MAG: class I SAM-dependent methyltransferase [Pseudooceanicola nanhaiensis]
MTETTTEYDLWAALYNRTLGPHYRDRQIGFLKTSLLDHLKPGDRVLDLCCGAGQMMAPMLAQGLEVTGIDMSPAMLLHARQNAPGATVIEGDARDFRLDAPVSGVICASASLNHMSDLGELGRVFRSVNAALVDYGTFVFDINHPAQMARHWLNRPAAGDIRRDHAWLITPRYDPATGTGAFRVDMYRRPEAGGSSAGPAPLLALLRRPILRKVKLSRLDRFAESHPDWEHRGADYPVHGHDLGAVDALLTDCGFDAQLVTVSGSGEVDENSAAYFVCRKRPAPAGMEAAE